MNYPFFIAILAFLVGIFLLERGADLFTDSIGELGERTGVSETVLGLLTAGMEWEELLVSIVAAFSGNVGIAVGNIVGANIANVLGTFSLGPLIRPVQVTTQDRRFGLFLGLVTTAVAGWIFFRPVVGRTIGVSLTVIFLFYLGILIFLLHRGLVQLQFEREEEGEEDSGAGAAKLFALAFAGLALILGGAHLVVRSAAWFASHFQISEFVIGLTVVAVGTTIPDKVITIAGALKGRSGIVTANLIGSNLFNMLFVLGLAAIIHPLEIDSATRVFDLPVLVGVTWFVVLLMFREKVGRSSGIVLMLGYAAYLAFNFLVK
jgi:cation:H+ antiporter